MQKQIVRAHVFLACFFLPMAVLYAITGGLYGLRYTGAHRSTDTKLALAAPLPSDLAGLVAIADAELRAQGIAQPTGEARIRKSGTSYHLEWSGSTRDIELHPTAEASTALFRVKEASAYRRFVQLHKAKGGDLFRYFAAAWMIGLLALVVSGAVMAFTRKPSRDLAIASTAAGVVVFTVLAVVS